LKAIAAVVVVFRAIVEACLNLLFSVLLSWWRLPYYLLSIIWNQDPLTKYGESPNIDCMFNLQLLQISLNDDDWTL